MNTWTQTVELIRAAKVAELNALLNAYQAKRFSCFSTCWVEGARKMIIERAQKCGVIPLEETNHV